MDCRECENLLAAYVSGDLSEGQVTLYNLHMKECVECKGSMEMYACLKDSIIGSPMITPTEEESLDLARSLRDVKLPSTPQPRRTWNQLLEQVALAVMCIVSFIIVAFIAWSVKMGQVSFSTIANPAILLPGIIIVIFIVSFLPIIITARRKPLNGMTFKR
ncbi:MAG: anti-sigma factor family protein [Armatimonadota bacterium]